MLASSLSVLEQESLDGARVYEIVQSMTGQDLTPTRPEPPAETVERWEETLAQVAHVPDQVHQSFFQGCQILRGELFVIDPAVEFQGADGGHQHGDIGTDA